MKKLSILVIMMTLISIVPALHAQEPQTPTEICDAALPAADPETREFDAAEQVLEPGVDYGAVFCTSAGAFYVDLFEDLTPITVNNFVFLSEQGFYNNTNFHRVLANFMAQAGDPTNTGTGGPGYRFEDEFVGFLSFDRPGLLAMANSGPATNGSQFFITHVPTPHLNNLHTIFGEVLDGFDNVVLNIELRDPSNPQGDGTELNTIVIVDDPSTVAIDYTPPTPATVADVENAFATIQPNLPDFLVMDDPEPKTISAAAATEFAPVDVQAAYGEYLTSHNHEYQITARVLLADCADLASFPITEMTYTMDAYASADDAAAAIDDAFLAELQSAKGLTVAETETETEYPIYVGEVTACDTQVVYGVSNWRRGRFVITAEIKYEAIENILPTEVLLTRTMGQQLFEVFLGNVLVPEMR